MSRQRNVGRLTDAQLQAANGCLFCAFIVETCRRLSSVHKGLNDDDFFSWEIHIEGPQDIPRLRMKGRHTPFDLLLDFYIHEGRLNPTMSFDSCMLTQYDTDEVLPEGSPFSILPRERDVNPDPLSAEVLSKIKAWIESCIRTHSDCAPLLISSAILPTRVLDIGSSSDAPVIHLKISEQHERGTYIALSHCWGTNTSSPILKTTRENLRIHMDKIEWSYLSKTFQDAITIARAVGVQFLWIDSLCILQGDKLDWEIEASLMERVYSQAYLVIAATAASSGSIGCCFDRQSSHRLAIVDSNNLTHSVCVRDSIVGDHFKRQDGSIDSAPLLSRAWCFQERLLSTRVLHYCRREVIAECKRGVWCECSGEWGTNHVRTPKEDYHSILHDIEDSDKLATAWRTIVQDYMLSELTYNSDRLVAISSIAKQFSSDKQLKLGRYLAGHWEKNDMIRSLLWSSTMGRKNLSDYKTSAATSLLSWLRRLPNLYLTALLGMYNIVRSPLDYWSTRKKPDTDAFVRAGESGHYISETLWAPSWSWASSAYPIHFSSANWIELDGPEGRKGTTLARILNFKCQPENIHAPFGSVSQGEIVLSGPFSIAPCYKTSKVEVTSEGFKAPIWIGNRRVKFKLDKMAFNTVVDDRTQDRVYCIWVFSADLSAPDENTHYMFDVKPLKQDLHYVYALVLKKVAGNARYCRIGMLEHHCSTLQYEALVQNHPATTITIV
jgi:hypothetical protein